MEESLYHKIREDMTENRRAHNKIVNSIENVREKQSDEAYFFVEIGKASPYMLFKESLKSIKNLEELPIHDAFLNYGLYKYKSHFIGQAIRN
ncbi:MAG: hypothetical protein ABIE36_02560 [Candidatus Diapherotrites archaeon]